MFVEFWAKVILGEENYKALLAENSGSKRGKEFHQYKSNKIKTDNFSQNLLCYKWSWQMKLL